MFYFVNFILNGAAGNLNGNRIAFFLANQTARQRGFDVQHAAFNIRFGFADDLIGLFLVRIFVNNLDGRAKFDRTGQGGRINDLCKGNDGFDLFDPAFNETLLFARRMIFCVSRQVPMFTGFSNFFNYF